MTVHAVKVLSAPEQRDNPQTVPTPGPPTIPSVTPDRVADALSNHTEAVPGQAEPAEEMSRTYDDVTYMKAVHRVTEDSTKTDVLDDIEAKLADIKWYKILYHQCDHDAEDMASDGGCSGWTVEREYGEIPPGI